MFTTAPGMRVWKDNGRVGRVVQCAGVLLLAIEESTLLQPFSTRPMVAFDTDDMPTCGAMLEQVEAESHAYVELWHCPDDPPEESGVVFIRARDFASYPGPTRGAALVAAMRSLKSAAKRVE